MDVTPPEPSDVNPPREDPEVLGPEDQPEDADQDTQVDQMTLNGAHTVVGFQATLAGTYYLTLREMGVPALACRELSAQWIESSSGEDE